MNSINETVSTLGRALLASSLLLWSTNAFAESIMVFAPHEDDEAIACAGIIRSAILRGDDVKLVMVTNGDSSNGATQARLRIQQTLSAMELLGLDRDDILYFGYADGAVLGGAYLDPSGLFTSYDGITQATYGFSDIGIVDYHYAYFGSHAAYKRSNLFTDFYDVIDRFRPQQIYMPSPLEGHSDHSVTGLMVMEAILGIKQSVSYVPIVHEYMIYRSGLPQATITTLGANLPVSNDEANMDDTPYAFFEREAVAVPTEMVMALGSGNNLKQNALLRYPGNADTGFERFIRADEVFWKRDMSNLAFSANVTVSSEDTGSGQLGQSVADGVILGYAHDNGLQMYKKEWVTKNELVGAWVKLAWSTAKTINAVVLHDRPNNNEHILSGTLSFSNGTTWAVSELPNNGSSKVIVFPNKTVSWVKFTVDSAVGSNIGLSEFEVYSGYTPYSNIARLGRITASSQTDAYGQIAHKAVDGVASGYPSDYTREWVTNGQLAGAWIQLNFTRNYLVNKITLHDRPNTSDHISSGVFTFSDGSSVNVASLPNTGEALTTYFTARSIKWVRFTVLTAEGANVGLSELIINGSPS